MFRPSIYKASIDAMHLAPLKLASSDLIDGSLELFTWFGSIPSFQTQLTVAPLIPFWVFWSYYLLLQLTVAKNRTNIVEWKTRISEDFLKSIFASDRVHALDIPSSACWLLAFCVAYWADFDSPSHVSVAHWRWLSSVSLCLYWETPQWIPPSPTHN